MELVKNIFFNTDKLIENNTVKVRCKDSINGVVIANVMIPRHIIQFD